MGAGQARGRFDLVRRLPLFCFYQPLQIESWCVCVCAAAKAEVRINFPLKTVEAACQLAEHYPFHGNFHRKMRHGHQTSIQEKGGLVVLYVGDDWRVF